MTTMLDIAQAYQRQGFKVYPLAPGTNAPLAGSHGFKDATTDVQQAASWWHDQPNANIGLGLTDTGILMLDLDRHANTGADGFATLRHMVADKRAGKIPPTYTETTPSNGLHLFFTYPAGMKLTQRANLFANADEQTGIDYNAQGVPIAPSRREDGEYKRYGEIRLTELAEVPRWLLDEIQRRQHPRLDGQALHPRVKRWSGALLDELVNGTTAGNRNDFLTRLCGKLFATGAEADTVYNLILVANRDFLTDPLPEHEVNTVFRSVLRREARRYE